MTEFTMIKVAPKNNKERTQNNLWKEPLYWNNNKTANIENLQFPKIQTYTPRYYLLWHSENQNCCYFHHSV